MAASSTIPRLVVQLRGSSRVGQASALKSLHVLAQNLDNCVAIRAAGIIPTLVARLGDGNTTMQQNAAGLLGLLVYSSPEQKAVALAAGAMPQLVTLLRGSGSDSPRSRTSSGPSGISGSSEDVQLRVLYAIQCMVVGSEDSAAALHAADGIAPLVQLLHKLVSAPAQLAVAGILTQVPIASQERTEAAIAAGAFNALVPLLWRSSEAVRLQAVWACRNLSWGNRTNHAAAAEAGCVPPLLHLLGDSSSSVQQQAAAALRNLASSDKHCAASLLEAGAPCQLVAFLQTCAECADSDSVGRDGGSISSESSGGSSASNGISDQRGAAECAADALAYLVGHGGPAAAAAVVSAAGSMQQLWHLLLTCGGEPALELAAPGLPSEADKGVSPAADAAQAAGGTEQHQGERPGGEVPTPAPGAQTQQPAAAEGGAAADRAATAAAPGLGMEAAAAGSPPAGPTTAPAAARPPAPKVCVAEGCGVTKGLKRCGGCASVRYCSAACSKAHWPAHKAECRHLQAAAAAQRPQLEA